MSTTGVKGAIFADVRLLPENEAGQHPIGYEFLLRVAYADKQGMCLNDAEKHKGFVNFAWIGYHKAANADPVPIGYGSGSCLSADTCDCMDAKCTDVYMQKCIMFIRNEVKGEYRGVIGTETKLVEYKDLMNEIERMQRTSEDAKV